MVFNSLQYAVFFVVVLAVYYRLDVKGQNRLIVAAGSLFYGLFDWRFLGLLYASILLDYMVGRRLGASEHPATRKLLLATSIAGQLGILAFFKYFNFFSDSAARLLQSVGLNVDPFTLQIVLPVGISFYTFQTLAYVFAVYRRQLDPERDLITFAAFVAWFPQMVAGPIERATSLMPQIRRRRRFPDGPVLESGGMLILRGLVKKVVIADSVARYVNVVYDRPGGYSWAALTLATIGFAVQVYGDFSGYSDIARGSSRLLGVELRRNFEQPFLSRDMRELWQRWHTSLRWWFTEFVANPLGGARHGTVRAMAVILLVFTLIGLWHGAAWNFVFWGMFNGVLVAAGRLRPVPPSRHPMKIKVLEIPQIVITFGLFCVGVVFFRADSFGTALDILKDIFSLRDGTPAPDGWVMVPVMLAAVLVIDLAERRRRIATIEGLRVRATLGESVLSRAEAAAESMTAAMRAPTAGVLIGVMLVAVAVFSGGAPTPFIYFNF